MRLAIASDASRLSGWLMYPPMFTPLLQFVNLIFQQFKIFGPGLKLQDILVHHTEKSLILVSARQFLHDRLVRYSEIILAAVALDAPAAFRITAEEHLQTLDTPVCTLAGNTGEGVIDEP